MNGASQDAIPVPSARRLAITTAIALAVAAIMLVTIVLPAEYGVDPLGTGERLGLTAMSRATARPVAMPAADADLKPTINGPISQYGAPFKTDAMEFTLGPYDYIEYKYALEEGAQMQFAWHAPVPMIHDFHGERADGQATSFDKNSRQASNGTFTAPFTGIHGWYWENPGGNTVTVTLKTAGFYASAIEFRSDKTSVPHTVRTP